MIPITRLTGGARLLLGCPPSDFLRLHPPTQRLARTARAGRGVRDAGHQWLDRAPQPPGPLPAPGVPLRVGARHPRRAAAAGPRRRARAAGRVLRRARRPPALPARAPLPARRRQHERRPGDPALPAPTASPCATNATSSGSACTTNASPPRASRTPAAGCTATTRSSDDGRKILAFDPNGSGRVAEVFGDLDTARRVSVVVPGVDTDLLTFQRTTKPYSAPVGMARSLYAAERVGGTGRADGRDRLGRLHRAQRTRHRRGHRPARRRTARSGSTPCCGHCPAAPRWPCTATATARWCAGWPPTPCPPGCPT